MKAGFTSSATPRADVPGSCEVAVRLEVCHALWKRSNLAAGSDLLAGIAGPGAPTARNPCLGLVGIDIAGTALTNVPAGASVELREGDHVLCDHLAHDAAGPPESVTLLRWEPADVLPAARFHGVATLWAFACVQDADALADALAASIVPGGLLCIDELWATSPADGQALGQALSLWHGALVFPGKSSVIAALSKLLVPENASDRVAGLKVEIRDALLAGEGVRNNLRQMPDETRRQRLPALARELHRALVLFDALDRGRLSAGRHIFRKTS